MEIRIFCFDLYYSDYIKLNNIFTCLFVIDVFPSMNCFLLRKLSVSDCEKSLVQISVKKSIPAKITLKLGGY